MSERVGWKRNDGWVSAECCGANFQEEKVWNELWGALGSEVTSACDEDCRKGPREENVAYSESGRDAIWFYAKQIEQ